MFQLSLLCLLVPCRELKHRVEELEATAAVTASAARSEANALEAAEAKVKALAGAGARRDAYVKELKTRLLELQVWTKA